MRTWVEAAVGGVLVAALIAAGWVAVDRGRQVEQRESQLAALEQELGTLTDRVDELEAELAAAREQGDASDPGDLLGGLLDGLGDGEVAGELDGLLEGLLDGDLAELFEGLLDDGSPPQDPQALGLGATPDTRCLLPDAGAGLDALLGGAPTEPRASADDPRSLVDDLRVEVAEERGLDWQQDVEVAFLDGAQVGERLGELLDEDGAIDPAQVDRDERALTALRAIEPDTDLIEVQRALLEDSVAGFYVPDTGELVVRVPDDGRIRGIDRVTIVHELGHAVTDQVLGLPDTDAPPYRDDADARLAALALIEGDATLLMNRWAVGGLDLTDQLAALADPELLSAQAALDAVPHHLQRDLLSPYTDGLTWVCDQWLDGGWAAVDAAYADPPTTSAEVLFGDRIDPAPTAAPSAPNGWRPVGTTTFGAAPLLWLFEAPGGDTTRALDRPRDRAAAWAGGSVSVWADGDASIVGLALVDGGGSEVAPLCTSLQTWFEAAVPDARPVDTTATHAWEAPVDGDAAALWCDDDDVVLVVAPDATTAGTMAVSPP